MQSFWMINGGNIGAIADIMKPKNKRIRPGTPFVFCLATLGNRQQNLNQN